MQSWTTEEEYKRKYLQYRSKARLYLEQIDLLLQNGSIESLYILVGLYQKEDFVKTYASALDELAYAAILANITGKELYQQEERIFATDFRSVKEFISCWKEMKFLLWEMEFETDEYAAERFFQYMKQGLYSSVVWEYLIVTSAVKPGQTCEELILVCENYGDKKNAVCLKQLMQDRYYEQ